MQLINVKYAVQKLFNSRWPIAITIMLLLTVNAAGQNINRKMVNELLEKLQKSKEDTNRISILIELGKFHVFKPGEAAIDLDSGFSYLQQARQLSDSLHSVKWRHESESMLAIYYMEKGDVTLGRSRFLQMVNDCRKTGDKETEAISRVRMGVWLRTSDENIPEVLENFQMALAIYRDIKSQENEILVLKEIANTHLDEGKIDLAEKESLEVLKRFKAINYPKLHYTYNLLSNICRIKGKFKEGLLYAMESIESMNKTKDTLSAAIFYGDLAQMYIEVGNYEKGIEWHKKSLLKWREGKLANFSMYNTAGFIVRYLIEKKRPHEALSLIVNLVREIPTNTSIQKACVSQNLAYCYDALQNYQLAEQYYLEALKWYTSVDMNFEASQEAQQDIGKFYLERKKYKKAGDYLRKALAFVPQKLAVASIKDIHLMLFKIDSVEGNYLSAINHFSEHKALNDSIFNSTKIREIEELQIKYETQKKEQDIQLLSNQSKLQQTQLQQANLIKNVTFGGVVLLLVIVGLLHNQYRVKKQNNDQLQIQQKEISAKNTSLQRLLEEKEWLLKEIHHRVKNNLQTVISLLESQSTYLENDALFAIQDSQHRVYAMSLIHQQLYRTGNVTNINMAVFLPELVNYLQEIFNTSQRIRFGLNIETIELDVTQAMPLGLILNEAITNSLKYAFPYSNNGLINITLKKFPDDRILLAVADNGIGLPANFDNTTISSLGMRLMKGLTEDINGMFDIKSCKGTAITIYFKNSFIKQSSGLTQSKIMET